MNERAYALSPIFFVFRDAADDHRVERLEFHVKSGDYFPMLATIFGFLEETVKECGKDETQYQLIKDVRKDLMHLYRNYRIERNES